MRKKCPLGFSLLELMVVIVIIGILAAIAYPSYSNYVIRARRGDAQAALTQIANRLDKFFGYCNSYPTSATPLSSAYPATCPTDAATLANAGLGLGQVLGGPVYSPERHYLITMVVDNSDGSCAAAGGPCNPLPPSPPGLTLARCQAMCGYTLVADPTVAGTTLQQRNDGRFRIDSRGVKDWDRNNSGTWEANERNWTGKP
jgi:type IV pilus assembly protein PilE